MSDVDNKVKMIVEGLLMAAGRPLSLDSIIAVFARGEKPDRKELKAVMEAIAADCDDRGFELKQVASGYRFQVKQDLSEWVAKLWEEKPPRYTRALLETLALIAYRQPITRGDIEDIRGVAVSPNIIRTLLDRDWVRVVGHRDVPGRPALFATTKVFLDYFNLKSLQELPPLSEIKEMVPSEPEIDLAEELAKQRVIDLPDEDTEDGEGSADSEGDNTPSLTEREQLLAEEAALELAQKPLDEILGLSDDAANDDDEPVADNEEDVVEQESVDNQDHQGEQEDAGQDGESPDADNAAALAEDGEELPDSPEQADDIEDDEEAADLDETTRTVVEPAQTEGADYTGQSSEESDPDAEQADPEQASRQDSDDEDILEFSTAEIEKSSDR